MSDNGLSFALDYKKFGSFVVDVDMIKAAGYTSFLKVYKMRLFHAFYHIVHWGSKGIYYEIAFLTAPPAALHTWK